jgi:flagellum-specific peptidoglycan hydrolase FlgJ
MFMAAVGIARRYPQWTDEGGGDDAQVQPAAARTDETQARKERFVDAHLADTEEISKRLGVPVENILALSAFESGKGRHPFAANGNNFFGIHYPVPYAIGYVPAGRGNAKVATFASYSDSLRSFEAISGSIVRGIADAGAFAAALWNSGKFGVGNPTYVPDLGKTIRGLRSMLSRRRI